MPNDFTRIQINDSFQELSHQISSVMSSNANTAETFFNGFMNFCETDQVLVSITSPLKEFDIPFNEWWNKTYPNGSRIFVLPEDPLKRQAFLYQLCLKIYRNEFKYHQIGFAYFKSSHINDNISQFNQNVIQILNRYFNQKMKGLFDSIPVDDSPISPSMIYVSGDNPRVNINSVDQSTNIVKYVDMSQFDEIETVINQIQDERERIIWLNSFNDLKGSVRTESYVQKYQQFIATAADHITLIAPFMTFLAGLLPS
ncbi:hypothetical protein [Methanosphaerula subterraneus]|uniref:hypothetical protein n=1 Tax=Methanosphaerula subterraneus TaxID=3350244 RepID=UPI003F8382BA